MSHHLKFSPIDHPVEKITDSYTLSDSTIDDRNELNDA